MAHFAELDKDNKVLRVVVGCNQDIANNGGEQSQQAAEYFKTICPLSSNGVKWVQTSYNNNFRKQYAGIGFTYDLIKDKFIGIQPYPSWSLDLNDNWKSPVIRPELTEEQIKSGKLYRWNEDNQSWNLSTIFQVS